MNWVGGTRSRFMKKSDTKKQREFFEKKRMQKKQNLLRPPSSPKEGNTVNMDLLTMFIVNQISFKKEHIGKPKILQADLKGPHKYMGERPLELPMSPCSPSNLNLAHSQPQYSPHTLGLKRRKSSLLDEFKFKVMSPVQECSLSDNSGSDYQHHIRDNLSPFSSTSSVSAETFNLQPRPIACISCPSPWKSSCTTTPQADGVCEHDPWTTMPYQTQIPQSCPPVQFESALHSRTETNRPSIEHLLTPLEKNNNQDKSLFLEFNGEEVICEDFFSERTHKNHLQKETPTLLTRTYESHNTDNNAEFMSQQIYRCANFRACSVDTADTKNTSESPTYYSPREGCASSDDEEDHRQGMQTRIPPMKMCHCEHTPISQFWSEMNTTASLTPALPFSQQTDTPNAGMRGKASLGTQDTETHTTAKSCLASCDALEQDSILKAHRMNISNVLTAPVQQCENHKVMGNTPWRTLPTRETKQQAPKAITGQESSCKPKNQECINKWLLFPLNSSHVSAPESEESVAVRGGRCEGHKQESANPDPTRSAGGTEEHTGGFGAESSASWVCEETETLHEIANILLMLKYRNKHG